MGEKYIKWRPIEPNKTIRTGSVSNGIDADGNPTYPIETIDPEDLFIPAVTEAELAAIDIETLSGHEMRRVKLSDGGTTLKFFNATTGEWE